MEPEQYVVYKIKDTKTGLYSTSGTQPTFTTKGKEWYNVGHVKSHLKAYKAYRSYMVKEPRKIPSTWVLETTTFAKKSVEESHLGELLLQMGEF